MTTLSKQIEAIVKDLSNDNPACEEAIITKVIEEYCDIRLNTGDSLKHLKYIGTPLVDGKCLVVYPNGEQNNPLVLAITGGGAGVDIVTSWESITSDSKVPSEKLTKDTLDTKADTSSLSTVATTGDYDDLTDKPNLATVATTGSYSDLINKPSIPTKTSDIINDGDDGTHAFLDTSDLTGTFTELQTIIGNGGTVALTKDYKNTDNKTSLTLTNSLTLDGQGHTIDGNNYDRLFKQTSSTGITITLKNLTLQNFQAPQGGGGGVIYSNVQIILINCILKNNTAPGSGGAVYGESNTIKIVNSSFINNKALSTQKDGGAIWTGSNTYLFVSNSVFESNTCDHVGGAIYSSTRAKSQIKNSVFQYNSSVNANGGSSYGCQFYNCTFMDNTAPNGLGGAVRGGDVYDSLFINNSANGGGAISANNTYEAVNCIFYSNSDTTEGGVVIKNYTTT